MPVSAELGPKLEKYLAKLIKSGRYNSKSEAIRDGLRLLQEKELAYEELRKKLEAGVASLKAGKGKPIEQVAAELKARYAAMAKARKAKKAA